MADINFASHRKLQTELSRLDALWKTVDLSFEVTQRQFAQAIRDRQVDPASPVCLSSDPTTQVASHHYALQHRLRAQFPRYIRETLFVRLITTLEVFLVDLARDLFMYRMDLLHSNKRIEFSHAEVLALHGSGMLRDKILGKELRQLHSAGILEIAKFYDRYFGIKFSECLDGISILWEIHDRRHLLVHRLGRADSQYRQKYKYVGKAALSVDARYLRQAIDTIRSFTDRVVAKAHSLAAVSHEPSSHIGDRYDVEIEIESASEAADRLLSRSFHFVVNDRATGERTVSLRDILAYSRVGEEGRLLMLSGKREDVREFVRKVRGAEKKGQLRVRRTEIIKGLGRSLASQQCDLTRGAVEEIAKRLPPLPWPKHVHKAIAKKMGISNKQCSRAVSAIREDEVLMRLLGSWKED